jgi:hypothetical protein
MADDHDEDRPAYDPSEPAAPERAPPLRETAPQSQFTPSQVATGLVILVIGLGVTFGLGIALA